MSAKFPGGGGEAGPFLARSLFIQIIQIDHSLSKQMVETLIRCYILIRVWAVCLCICIPQKDARLIWVNLFHLGHFIVHK